MKLQELKELKEKIEILYNEENNAYFHHNLNNMLITIDRMIAINGLEEAEKRIDEERVRQKIKDLRAQLPEPQKCSLCPNPLFDAIKSSDEEPYAIDGKPVCRDCYFNELGDFIEKNPIWTPFGSLNEHK